MSPALHEQGNRLVMLSYRQAVLSSVPSTTQLCMGAVHKQKEHLWSVLHSMSQGSSCGRCDMPGHAQLCVQHHSAVRGDLARQQGAAG